jgi:hypothetical protein
MTESDRLPSASASDSEEDSDWSDALTRVIPSAAALPVRPPRLAATAFLPPPVLPRPPVLGAPSTPPRTPQHASVPPAAALPAPGGGLTTSPVRRAIYLLVPFVLGLFAVSYFHRPGHTAEATPALQVPSAASGPVISAPSPPSRPVIDTRRVDAATAKQAASAFARGDYREALAQYRALAQQQPDEIAYRSLIAILERRLAPKTSE